MGIPGRLRRCAVVCGEVFGSEKAHRRIAAPAGSGHTLPTMKKTGTRMTREKRRPDIDHHLSEWTSGKRGGGKVPADFGWRTNPKQNQEERGANVTATKDDKKP